MKPDPATALPRRPSPGAAGARLGALYEEHARMVFGVCRLMLRDPDEAEDATQQVFLSAYRSLLVGTEPRNAGAWLGTIARNEARGRIATRRVQPVGGFDGDREQASVTLEEQAVARAELAELRDELSVLPERQREAVVLRDLYGLRYDEVARALGISRPAVEALLFRGRRRLQRRLRPELAAGMLAVPLALRESLAYAVPGFAAGGASTGLLAKLAALPVAAKLAAAGATVGVAGSAGVMTEREPDQVPRQPVTALVQRMTTPQPAFVVQSMVDLAQAAESRTGDREEEAEEENEAEEEDENENEDVLSDAREEADDREKPVEERDEPEERDELEGRDGSEEAEERDDRDERPLLDRVELEGEEDDDVEDLDDDRDGFDTDDVDAAGGAGGDADEDG